MFASHRSLAAAAAAAVLALAGCGSPTPGKGRSATPTTTASTADGMHHMADGNGLADTAAGYRLTSRNATLPANRPADYRFTIAGPDRKPVTGFALDQTKRMHFYAIRSDLTGFQHVHPAMAADGTWTAGLAALKAGSWRVFASFTPDSGSGKGRSLVLSRTVTVPGAAARTPLPAPARSTRVDGYTVAVKGRPTAGQARPLTITITRAGQPVTDLEPYLDAYAHLTAFHQGDTAFAHLHPATGTTGAHGGPTLTFHAELPSPGRWRLFLQFQTHAELHTAALTLHAG